MATITLRSPTTTRNCGYVRPNANLATTETTATRNNSERGALTQTNVRQWQGCRTWPDCGTPASNRPRLTVTNTR